MGSVVPHCSIWGKPVWQKLEWWLKLNQQSIVYKFNTLDIYAPSYLLVDQESGRVPPLVVTRLREFILNVIHPTCLLIFSYRVDLPRDLIVFPKQPV